MISTRLMLCCESTIEDKSRERLMIYSLIENVPTLLFPITIPKMDVLIILDREQDDPDEIKCSIKITLNDTVIIENLAFSINFFGQDSTRVIYTFSNITISEKGNLKFTLIQEDNELDSYSIKIKSN